MANNIMNMITDPIFFPFKDFSPDLHCLSAPVITDVCIKRRYFHIFCTLDESTCLGDFGKAAGQIRIAKIVCRYEATHCYQ